MKFKFLKKNHLNFTTIFLPVAPLKSNSNNNSKAPPTLLVSKPLKLLRPTLRPLTPETPAPPTEPRLRHLLATIPKAITVEAAFTSLGAAVTTNMEAAVARRAKPRATNTRTILKAEEVGEDTAVTRMITIGTVLQGNSIF